MFKFFTVLAGLLCLWVHSFSQIASIDDLLQTIENNNSTLGSYRSYIKGKNLEYQLENKLPDPQVSAYYLPFGEHAPGDYSEFEIAQRLEMPGVYATRKKWIGAQEERLDLKYMELRQEILLKAKKLALDWAHLQKQYQLTEGRVAQARKLYQQMQTLFEKGQIGILDLNKSKISWLDQQFALEELASRESILQSQIESLNGGEALNLTLKDNPPTVENIEMDSLWQERMTRDPRVILLEREIAVARQSLELERKKKLPEFTAGYNYQGVQGNNYWGLYGGISVPLWRGKHQVELAEAQLDYSGQYQIAELTKMKADYDQRVERYELLQTKFEEYQKAMSGLNSAELLYKSFELGEISFMDYYREISFYRQAENRMLEMKHELQLLHAELLQHRL
ncbi:MAG TPA: TolC family protein [Saprospiraceae bacterium]|nr:TolC family protein [Saprospiraceae bacterium]